MAAFAVRSTYKPRFNPHADDGSPMHVPDADEIKAIIAAIQRFKQKSAHSSIQNLAELQTVLGKSSVNPEVNPMAKEGVEIMLRGKHEAEKDSLTDALATSSDGMVQAGGFSSLSVARHNNKAQQMRLEKELEKELGEIKKEAQRKRQLDIKEDDEDIKIGSTTSASSALLAENNQNNSNGDIGDDSNDGNDCNDDEDDQDDDEFRASLNQVVAPGFGAQMIRPGTAISVSHLASKSQDPQAKNSKNTNPELNASRKSLTMGYPARAALARGYTLRRGGQGGMAVRKTAMGIADAF